MKSRLLIATGLLSLFTFIAGPNFKPSASAHDYEEVLPPSSGHRDFFITILEDAKRDNRLRGPKREDMLPVSTSLELVLNNLSTDDIEWLGTAPYTELETELYGRLPANVVAGMLERLIFFALDFEQAQYSSKEKVDATAVADFERLRTLRDTYWGRS